MRPWNTVITVLICAAFYSAHAQHMKFNLKPAQGEMSEAAARQAVLRILKTLNQPMGEPMEKWNLNLRESPLRFEGRDVTVRYWNAFTGHHGGTASESDWRDVSVDSRTGVLLTYYNSGRAHDQFRHIGRTGKVAFANGAHMKAHLLKLAKLLGVPNTPRSKFRVREEGSVRDANSAGSFGVTFQNARGFPVASISCDPQDGQLVLFDGLLLGSGRSVLGLDNGPKRP